MNGSHMKLNEETRVKRKVLMCDVGRSLWKDVCGISWCAAQSDLFQLCQVCPTIENFGQFY